MGQERVGRGLRAVGEGLAVDREAGRVVAPTSGAVRVAERARAELPTPRVPAFPELGLEATPLPAPPKLPDPVPAGAVIPIRAVREVRELRQRGRDPRAEEDDD